MKGVSGILIVVLALVLLGGGIYFITDGFKNISTFQAEVTGQLTVLSVSKTEFISNDPTIGGSSWLVTIVQNQGGQSITTGTIQNEDIKDGTKTAKSDLRINAELKKNFAEYTIRNDFQNIFFIEVFKAENSIIESASEWCTTRGAYAIIKPTQSFDNYCLRKSNSGVFGIVSQPTQIFESEVSVVKLDPTLEVVRTTVSNMNQRSASLGSVGIVQWNGNLVSGVPAPSPTDQDIAALYTNGKWVTIDKSDFDSWRGSLDPTEIPTCSVGRTYDQFLICIQQTNQLYQKVLVGKDFVSDFKVSEQIIGDVSSGKIVMNLERQLQYPILTFRLKTDWIGINVPVGKPDILYATSDEFRTGDIGFIKVTVKNIGDNSGSFDVSAICQSPFSSNDASRVALLTGQQTDVYLKVTASVPQSTTGSCLVKAVDSNNPNNQDSITVSVSARNIIFCQAGQKRAIGNLVQQCNPQGSGWTTILICNEGEIADPITFICVSTTPPKPPPPPIDYTTLLYGVLIIMILMFVLLITYKLVTKKKR